MSISLSPCTDVLIQGTTTATTPSFQNGKSSAAVRSLHHATGSSEQGSLVWAMKEVLEISHNTSVRHNPNERGMRAFTVGKLKPEKGWDRTEEQNNNNREL